MAEELQEKFCSQKDSARIRGIEFKLTFEEWLQIWTDSGHLHERGRKRGQYCMARFGDKGAYEIGNVKIILHRDNVSEGMIAQGKDPNYIKKLSKRMLGNKNNEGRIYLPLTPEQKARHKESLKRRPPLTPEQCAKISSAKRGKRPTLETRAKLSKAKIGNKNSLGYKHSQATREKRRAVALEYWRKQRKQSHV